MQYLFKSKLNQKSYKLCRIICLTEEDLLALTFDWLCLLFKFLLEHSLTNDKNPSMGDRNGDSPSLAIEGQLPEMSSKIANLWFSETLYASFNQHMKHIFFSFSFFWILISSDLLYDQRRFSWNVKSREQERKASKFFR